jgi:outer membrane immunogenic protein
VANGPAITLPAGTFASATSGSTTRLGWTVGGGIEWAFDRNWSLAAEYRHSDFGSVGFSFIIPDGLGTTFATGTTSARVTVDQATLRLNYRFGGPVVARY